MFLLSTFVLGVLQRGGFGQIRGSKQQQPEEEEEEETAPQNPLGGLFGFGAKKAKVCIEMRLDYKVHPHFAVPLRTSLASTHVSAEKIARMVMVG